MIRFLLDGQVTEIEAGAQETALHLIRERLGRKGTKEGCGEGDCGACTVLLGEIVEGAVQWRAVNSCILFAPMLDGKALVTVESLGTPDRLCAVQGEMVTRHGSQCGFCTPGFIMSLEGRARGGLGTVGRPVADVLSGNLCRCTGYGPILDSAAACPPALRDDGDVLAGLAGLPRGEGENWHAPRSTDELAALLAQYPEARIVAGATDVGLWVTKQLRDLGRVIFIGDVADLRGIEENEAGVTLGAAARYSEGWDVLARLHPDLGELVRRIAGTPVRNAGTIGGNIANGSPIGDMPPALIALGATLTLRRGDRRREMALEDYFLAYGKQDRREGEFVEGVFIPRPAPEAVIAITKLSKRFDSDISAVLGAFHLTIEDGVITRARIAFGGMAATPKRAHATEEALIGKAWEEASIEAAIPALSRDYQPLSDVRGSSAYRLAVAGNLLRRLWLAQSGEAVSVLEVGHG
ncbi:MULTISPECIES: xanthine dehydrogenase small subunit [unclassified Novosphingobium]|uniref:xanthine dehydrogenase small subunit n=1 Tax=unclassified Novosphingobium TaxID=2644732 RepID=UPI000868B913|nr:MULTISPECIES: xanthine dehydrogenase small subunit [unclassified Novosphingobium]MBN9143064.1 xanthine dehydrogenase small subunit [Novosphingobium sp.]MDR6706150.1 xanthine dehydrogenase small subunit [Novosphingobium sp. 1748]ODU84805.1 MAG: xanthine dehydrogenase small subunit [Novosphingobium sp. SCN 63-17]OJX89414.1 MAG: xanthine dehydrogenase small subunit [Novosphingobium sp. 63-713]